MIKEFAKTVNIPKNKTEQTVYGTAKVVGDAVYVQLDGSNTVVPVDTTVDVLDGERVTAMIKNHSTIITGNISSPSARAAAVIAVEDAIAAESSDWISLNATKPFYEYAPDVEYPMYRVNKHVVTVVGSFVAGADISLTNAKIPLGDGILEEHCPPIDSVFVCQNQNGDQWQLTINTSGVLYISGTLDIPASTKIMFTVSYSI